MQLLVDRLDRPWGYSLQVGLLTGWMTGEDFPLSVHTASFESSFFPSIEKNVTQNPDPSASLDADEPALVGPYPATSWAEEAGLEQYSVIVPDLPWSLYPGERRRWLGEVSSYSSGENTFVNGLASTVTYPWQKMKDSWNRRTDRSAVQNADSVYIYDDRLRKPVRQVYEVEPELISPVAAVGPGKSTDPDNQVLCVGPYEATRNLKRILDAFYLFVNRLGTQRRDDWDGRNPNQLWHSGDFTLKLCGEGAGESFLRDYAESQQLEDQVEFTNWVPNEEYHTALSSSLAVLDVPLAGGGSSVVYHGLSLGVPAVHTHFHRGLDSLLENSPLSHKTSSTNADEIANKLLRAVQTPTTERQPNDDLKQALSVESGARRFLDDIK
jgi:glycosyltransferase involved in cell wall biosynthesis